MITIDHEAAKAKLLSRIVITADDCWEWQGCRRLGYGRIWLEGRLWTAHRIAAHVWLGIDLTDRKTFACHSCDNPPCVNPDHLFPGNQADNMRDMAQKGRASRVASWRPPQIHPTTRPCDICSTVYTPNPNKRGRSRVCSNECLLKMRAQNGQGRSDKLTADSVRAIRAGLEAGRAPKDLAAEFGISRPTITNIKKRKTWGHVA